MLWRAVAQPRTERSVAAPLSRFDETLESTGEAICVLDRSRRITYRNLQARNLLALDPELFGVTPPGAFDNEMGGALWRACRSAMTDRAAAHAEEFRPALDAWIELRAEPVEEGIAIFFRDVTAAKRASAAAQERERWYRDLLDALPAAIYTTDAAGAITFYNHAATEFSGQHPIIGEDSWCVSWKLFTADGVPLAHDACPMAVAIKENRAIRGAEAIAERPDGTRIPFISYPTPICDASGTLIGAVNMLVDITDRKRQETLLQQSEAHLARAQQLAALGSFDFDVKSAELRWSDEIYRLFGVTREDFTLSLPAISERIHPDDRASFDDLAGRCGAGIAPDKTELSPDYRIVRPDGEVRTCHCRYDLVIDENGGLSRLVGTLQDVTGLRDNERQRRELEAQLLQSQKLESLGSLAGGIAHEFNNMLVPIVALTKLVQTQLPAGSRERANLEIVREAGCRAKNLVAQILVFSRKENPKREATNLRSVVRNAVTLLRAAVPATIRIELNIEKVPSVLADSGQIHQVLLNLVSNAAHSIGGRIGLIRVTLSSRGEAGIRLSVSDTGDGIDEATQGRIFEPFFTTKAAGEGTGLGLSVVHGIVTNHGGHITVTSNASGTRFDIDLPAQVPAMP